MSQAIAKPQSTVMIVAFGDTLASSMPYIVDMNPDRIDVRLKAGGEIIQTIDLAGLSAAELVSQLHAVLTPRDATVRAKEKSWQILPGGKG